MAIQEGEVLAGFFYLSSRSELDISKTRVANLTGKMGAAVQMTTDSTLMADWTAFMNLETLDKNLPQSAIIYAQNGKLIDIKNKSYFANNTANDIYSISTKVNIENSKFVGL